MIINNIPREEEFYDKYHSVKNNDVAYAIKKYLGKDINYVINLYGGKVSSMGLVDDIRYLRVKAFSYYILATFMYLKNEKKDINFDICDASEAISILPKIIEEKLSENFKEMKWIFEYIIDFSNWTISNYDKFDEDCFLEDDVKEKYIKLIEKIGVFILHEMT